MPFCHGATHWEFILILLVSLGRFRPGNLDRSMPPQQRRASRRMPRGKDRRRNLKAPKRDQDRYGKPSLP